MHTVISSVMIRLARRTRRAGSGIKGFMFRGPSVIRLNPSARACNQACLMCDVRGVGSAAPETSFPEDELSVDDQISIIRKAPLSLDTVEISGGGEPLIKKDIARLFPEIKKKGAKGVLITNGSLLSDGISTVLVSCGWDSVRVSMNAASKKNYLKVHGADHFDIVVNNIKHLIKTRGKAKYPGVGLHFVIQKDNYREILDLAMLADNIGVDRISFDTLIVNSVSGALALDADERKEAVKLLLEAGDRTTTWCDIKGAVGLLEYSRENMPRDEYLKGRWCNYVQDMMEIKADGSVLPCCMAFDIADRKTNIKDLQVKRAWDEYARFRKELKKGRFYSFCRDRCNYPLPLK